MNVGSGAFGYGHVTQFLALLAFLTLMYFPARSIPCLLISDPLPEKKLDLCGDFPVVSTLVHAFSLHLEIEKVTMIPISAILRVFLA